MELNRVLSSVVVMAMILFIKGHTTAEASCFQDCLNTCHGSPAQCVKKCFQECPVPPFPAPVMIDYAAPPSVTPDVVIDFPLAEERCFEKCINECKLPKEVECVGPCFDKCPFPPPLAPNNVLNNYHKAAVSEDSCFQDCLNTCHGSPVQCVRQCFQKCPVPPSAAPDVPNSCFQDCLNTCHGSPAQCVKQCFLKCPIPPSAATAVNDLYRCKLGCSLHQCAKYSSDTMKMGSCMKHCSIKNCDIKQPSPL